MFIRRIVIIIKYELYYEKKCAIFSADVSHHKKTVQPQIYDSEAAPLALTHLIKVKEKIGV